MSEQTTPLARQDTRPRGMPGLTWAIILIAVGVIFLLNNLHLANFTVDWVELLRYWPVLLILVGLDILIGRNSVFGSLAAAAIAVVVIGGLVWFVGVAGNRIAPLGAVVTQNISQPLGDVKALNVQLDLGVSETTVKALSNSKNAAEGQYSASKGLDLTVDYTPSGDTGTLRIAQKNTDEPVFAGNVHSVLNLGLTDAVPLTITVNAGVGQATLDLRKTQLKAFTLDSGVGEMTVMLPNKGQYTVTVKSGVGAITILIPKGYAARLNFDGGITGIDVPDGFAKVSDKLYQTPGYDSATDRATLQIDSGIGSVDITEE